MISMITILHILLGELAIRFMSCYFHFFFFFFFFEKEKTNTTAATLTTPPPVLPFLTRNRL